MPVELTQAALESALARLGEHDLDAPGDVEGALEWMVAREDDRSPILLRRYDLQMFLWYQLPCKWLTSLEHKRAVAERLGRFLELLGGRAEAYADICTSEQTMGMLQAWETEGDEARARLREALEASEIEPPDTEALEWGSFMGPAEAWLRDQVALELERAIETGWLDPAAREYKRRRAKLVTELLGRPTPELDGRTPLKSIGEERFGRWAERGSDERRAIIAPLTSLLADPGPAAGADVAEADFAPLAWLLEAAIDGIGLTQTGALNRALVRAAVERFPDWWNLERFGPPNREADIGALCQVHELARRMRLLRRRGRRLLLTKRGQALRDDPSTMLGACSPHLIDAEGFAVAVQELAAAVMLSRETVDRDDLEAAVHAAIVAEGWNADGEPPTIYDVAGTAWGLTNLLESLGLADYVSEFEPGVGFLRQELTLTPAGREALRLALSSRALGPARSI